MGNRYVFLDRVLKHQWLPVEAESSCKVSFRPLCGPNGQEGRTGKISHSTKSLRDRFPSFF